MKIIYRTLLKPLCILAAVAVVLGAVGWFLLSRGCGDRPRPSALQHGSGAPPGWTAPPTETTPWLPFQYNTASEFTAGFPAGSQVVVVETPSGPVQIAILPGGEVVVPPGTEAVVYKKRPPLIKAEFRPFIGIGAVGPEPAFAAAAGVDVLRVWRVNFGVGALANTEAIAAAAFASTPVWRNVDVRVAGGYGTAGAVGFAGVSIGIE